MPPPVAIRLETLVVVPVPPKVRLATVRSLPLRSRVAVTPVLLLAMVRAVEGRAVAEPRRTVPWLTVVVPV